ncbi:MAG TPA: hypothetical protein PK629_04610 [Oscillospiraceae bacterium]|nr:hypothetical protein [Oscillospiraceae bacterium]HPF57022.1 hypothetical protein [Clostridiales bacterium]HPK34827.1 hypothetical protein [Oscillospiraceae bacterium]
MIFVVEKRMLTVALTAAFLVCCAISGTAGCAPPPDPYSAPAPIDNSSQIDTTVRNVTLTESEYKKEAQILAVRLPDLIGSSAEITELNEMYVGPYRYALARCQTLSHEDQWLLFCFDTGSLELLAQNATLVSHDGINEFYFNVTETENGILKLPRSVQFLRVSDHLLEYTMDDGFLSADIAGRTGPVDVDGSPVNYDPLPSLDLLTVTASGIEMGFSRANGDGLFYPFTDIAYHNGAFTISLSGCLLSGSVSETFTPSDFSAIESVEIQQIGINIEITVKLSLKNPHYSFSAAERTQKHSVTTLNFS